MSQSNDTPPSQVSFSDSVSALLNAQCVVAAGYYVFERMGLVSGCAVSTTMVLRVKK